MVAHGGCAVGLDGKPFEPFHRLSRVKEASAAWPKVVGITGYARSGKDSSGKAFQRIGYTRTAMADPLKELALAFAHTQYPDLHNFITEAPDVPGRLSPPLAQWEKAKVLYPSVRQLLIDVGMSGRETFGEDFWVRMAVERAPDFAVFTDMRFLNERMTLANKVYGRSLPVPKPGEAFFLRVERPGVGPSSDFEREVPEIPVDAVVVNDGTLDELEAKVLDAFSMFVESNRK